MNSGKHFLGRGIPFRPREHSHLHSPRERSSQFRHWQNIRDQADTATHHANTLAAIQQQMARNLQKQTMVSSGMHPFKIYQLGPRARSIMKLAPAENEATVFWRRVRVRYGLYFLDAGGTLPTGTDEMDLPFDDVLFHKSNGDKPADYSDADIIVDVETPVFFIWIEANTSVTPQTAVIRYGPTPLATTYTSDDDSDLDWVSTNPWADYPALSTEHVMIGFVDSNTRKTQKQVIIHQLVSGHIVTVGSPCPP